MGGQLGRIPILSILDTVSVRWYMYVWEDNSEGSRVSLDT